MEPQNSLDLTKASLNRHQLEVQNSLDFITASLNRHQLEVIKKFNNLTPGHKSLVLDNLLTKRRSEDYASYDQRVNWYKQMDSKLFYKLLRHSKASIGTKVLMLIKRWL